MNFICPITQFKLSDLRDSEPRLNAWKKQLKYTPFNRKFLVYFGVSNIDDYISLIETNLKDDSKLNQIFTRFTTNKSLESIRLDEEYREKRLNLFKESIKYIDTNGTETDNKTKILIRLLEEPDTDNACILYTEYKKYSQDTQLDDSDIKDLVEDYILKHQIYGILFENLLVGCVIVIDKKFKIDGLETRVNTFYIQEIFINDQQKGKKYGYYLFNYIIKKCPENLQYISFMTKRDNIAMHRIAANTNFILQDISSGDVINPDLFIKINDDYTDE